MADWLNPLRWLLLRIERGHASWCGRYLIVHAPINWSLLMGRGTSGLWLYRWTERGHHSIRISREWSKKQKANR